MEIKEKHIPYFITEVWKDAGEDRTLYENIHGKLSREIKAGGMCMSECRDRPVFYSDLEGKVLTINRIKLEDGRFFAVEHARVHYVEEYNEVSVEHSKEGAGFPQPYLFPNGGFLGIHAFLSHILSRQEWYREVMKVDGLDWVINEGNSYGLLQTFLHNGHKLIPSILRYKDQGAVQKYMKALLCGKTDFDAIKGGIKKSVIQLAGEYNIPLDVTVKVAKKINATEIRKLCDILKKFNVDCDKVMLALEQTECENYTKLLNYMVKKCIIDGDFPIESNMVHVMLSTYNDYLLLTEGLEGWDLYPEDLQEAHDMALSLREKGFLEKKYDIKKFEDAVCEYKNLADFIKFDGIEYSFVIPNHPNDLIFEGKALHHCVGEYIKKVINGVSQIVFLRRKGEHYMTLEVKGAYLIQARKSRNAEPNKEDQKILEQWAGKHNIACAY